MQTEQKRQDTERYAGIQTYTHPGIYIPIHKMGHERQGTDRQTQRGRHTKKSKHARMQTQTDIHTYRQKEIHIDIYTEKYTQPEQQTGKPTYKHIET